MAWCHTCVCHVCVCVTMAMRAWYRMRMCMCLDSNHMSVCVSLRYVTYGECLARRLIRRPYTCEGTTMRVHKQTWCTHSAEIHNTHTHTAHTAHIYTFGTFAFILVCIVYPPYVCLCMYSNVVLCEHTLFGCLWTNNNKKPKKKRSFTYREIYRHTAATIENVRECLNATHGWKWTLYTHTHTHIWSARWRLAVSKRKYRVYSANRKNWRKFCMGFVRTIALAAILEMRSSIFL